MTLSNDWTPERLRALATEALGLPWLTPREFPLSYVESHKAVICNHNLEKPELVVISLSGIVASIPFSPTADDGRLLKWILEESGKWPDNYLVGKHYGNTWTVYREDQEELDCQRVYVITDILFDGHTRGAPTVTEAVMLALEANHGR